MNMKNVFIGLGAALVLLAGCHKFDAEQAFQSLEDRVEALEKLNDEVQALKSIIEGSLMVVSCEETDGLYVITLSDGTVLNVNSQESGCPAVAVITENGRNYWGYYKNGKVEPLLFAGKKVEVTSLTPAIRVNEDNKLEISVDGGRTWTESETRLTGGLFSKVEQLDDCILMTMSDGFTEFRVPFVDDSNIQFFSFSGKQFFTNGQVKEIPVQMVGIETFTVTEKPEGWKVVLSEGKLTVTAPAKNVGETAGYIKMLGIGEDPKIAQLYVTIGTAPCLLTIDDTQQVTIKPNPQSCFYGAALLEEFNPKTIVVDINGITSPMMSRFPFTSAQTKMPLSDLVGEVVLGQTYVVWAMPYNGYAVAETDLVFEAVTSIGVTSAVENVTFEDARITISVKGSDAYYLVPLLNEMTIEDVLTDLNGPYAASYDRYRHKASFRGLLSSVIESPVAGTSYDLLVLPLKAGKPSSKDAVAVNVKLNEYLRDGETTVSLTAGETQYKSVSANVEAGLGAYKIFVAAVPDADYQAGNYASDQILLDYLTSLQPVEYSGAYSFTATGLESGSKFWIVSAAIDRNGFIGAPARLECSTKAVEYSSININVEKVSLTVNSAKVQMQSVADIVSYRYMCMSASGGGYWYGVFAEDSQAAYEALIYGTAEYTDIDAATAQAGISFSDLEIGTDNIFCVIGYDKDGKITNMAKTNFSPTVGTVTAATSDKWKNYKPSVSSTFSGTEIKLNVTFPNGCSSFVLTKMSSEEYYASMPGSARQRTDYVVGHYDALVFRQNLVNYVPEWYISSDRPYIVIAWEDESGWYEPLVYDSATGNILN